MRFPKVQENREHMQEAARGPAPPEHRIERPTGTGGFGEAGEHPRRRIEQASEDHRRRV